MDLRCDTAVADAYRSKSQRARVISEAWFAREGYCLACDADELRATRANTPATDFVCPKCAHRYELKAFQRRPGKALNDGAYDAMLKRIGSGSAPTLCLLERNAEWMVHSLGAVHASFLIPEVVVPRKPLAATAQRAGWVGCTIRLDRIGPDGEVAMVSTGKALPVPEVRRRFQRYLPLAQVAASRRGWTMLTLRLLRRLGRREFLLREVYALAPEFAREYPENHHVEDKIRQQLQVLRDLGVVEFLGRGEYRLLD